MNNRKLGGLYSSVLVQFTNCRILWRGKLVREDLWIQDGKIMNPESIFFDNRLPSDFKIDCRNLIIVPGFIDVQINGGFGYDFSSQISRLEEALDVVSKGLLKFGVTSFCPTVVSSPPSLYREVLPKMKHREGGSHGAEIIGAHIEGPFINISKKGAHDPAHIVSEVAGMKTLLDVYGSFENVSIITVAPELPGVLDVIPELVKEGVVVSIGHTAASLGCGEQAMCLGASFITHLFNAMQPFHHRDPGIMGVLTSNVPRQPTFYGLISDGVHTHPTALRIAYRSHPNGVVLVTDAMAAMGLTEGRHVLGSMLVDIKGKEARLVDSDTLAGSICSMDRCIRHFKKGLENCPLEQAIEAATLHPAQLLGITHQKGTLEYGTDADFVIIDDNINVHATFIAGAAVFIEPSSPMFVLEKYLT